MANQQTGDHNQNSKKKKIVFVFGIFMVLIYMGMAFLLIFSPIFTKNYSDTFRYIIGALFFLYGLFRGYRIIKEN